MLSGLSLRHETIALKRRGEALAQLAPRRLTAISAARVATMARKLPGDRQALLALADLVLSLFAPLRTTILIYATYTFERVFTKHSARWGLRGLISATGGALLLIAMDRFVVPILSSVVIAILAHVIELDSRETGIVPGLVRLHLRALLIVMALAAYFGALYTLGFFRTLPGGMTRAVGERPQPPRASARLRRTKR